MDCTLVSETMLLKLKKQEQREKRVQMEKER